MANYDAINRMNSCFNALEETLNELEQFLIQLELLQARVFVLPDIEKGSEHTPTSQISVLPYQGDSAHQLGLQHFTRLFIHHNAMNISSKSAVRLPGVMCYSVDPDEQQTALLLIKEVNKRKNELERIVTIESGLAREERFEFVHRQLHGLITLNAYRSIVSLLNPDSVRFGWANKNMIKNVTRDEVLAQLEKSLQAGRSVPPYSREQWRDNVTREIMDVKKIPANATLKIKRPVKVQPIARVWYRENQKQVQHPCPSPLIALCLHSDASGRNIGSIPTLGELNDYDVNTVRHKYKPNSQPLNLLIKRLHLYTDYPL